MKILLINDYQEKIGGAEVYIHELLNYLQERGHEVKLFTSNVSQLEYSYRIKHITLRDYLQRLFNLSAYHDIKKIAKSFSPDVVHVHGIFNELSPSVIYALKQYPIVMTVHNNQLVSPLPLSVGKDGTPCKDDVCSGCLNCVGWKGTIYEYIKRTWYKFLLIPVKLYICPSDYMCKQLRNHGFRNATKLENGISLLKYEPIYNFDTLLFIGQLIREKGCHVLIRAMKLISEKIPTIKLIIAGEGSEEDELKKLVKTLSLEKNIRFIGKLSRMKLNNLYRTITCTVVPSLMPDNFPTVCLESISAGRPVIGSATGGIPEIIEDGQTGLLAKPNNHIELANKIIHFLSDKKAIVRMSEHAHSSSTQYSFDNHLNKLEKIYKSLSEQS